MKCLENIIGITRDHCPCYTANLTQDLIEKMGVSKSGLYLDELEGGVFLRNVVKLDKCMKFVEMQFKAIESAKQYFERDLLMKFNEKYHQTKKGFLGAIGQASFSGSIFTNKRLQYLKIKAVSDGLLQIDNVRIIVGTTITTDVQLVGMKQGESQGTIIAEALGVTLNAGMYTGTGLKAIVPLVSNGEYQDYYIVYDNQGANVRDTKISCGCSGGNGWEQFINVVGGQTDSYSDFNNGNTDTFSHGILVDSSIRCGVGALVCDDYDASEVIALGVAHAIRYKAGELLIENILNSGEVNAFTLLGNERLWGKRNHYIKEYNTMMDYIVATVDTSRSDCYICSGNDIKVTTLLI